MRKVEIGDVVVGRIIGIQQYGAFVRLENGEEGLIHISEIKEDYVKEIGKEFWVGQKVKVKVIDIDPYNGQLSLSTRALQKSKIRKVHKHFWTSKSVRIGFKPCREELVKELEKRVAKRREIR